MVIIMHTILEWKPNQSISNVLKSIYGVGEKRSRSLVCNVTGRYDFKLSMFKSKMLSKCSNLLYKRNYIVKKELILLRKKNLRRLRNNFCYRGVRLMSFLPSHGQRTKSNGMTARFQGSKTFDFVPTSPVTGLKKMAHYVKRTAALKKLSADNYQKQLSKNFQKYQLQFPEEYKYSMRKGQLGVFNKMAGVKRAKSKDTKKKETKKKINGIK